MSGNQIGARIKARREEIGLSQEEASAHFGFKDRQTLSAIETGERRITPEELALASDLLRVPVGFFTDPFLLVGEGRFSWRQDKVVASDLAAYETEAGRIIAAYRALSARIGQQSAVLRPRIGLTRTSSYEDAAAAGSRLAEELGLGEAPAHGLAAAMERLGILVLMVDTIEGVSGAACRLPELDAVLINRNEVAGRRNWDTAHELFHVLTWDAMPPSRVEDATAPSRGRVEQLADNFARGLLMPVASLEDLGPWTDAAGAAASINSAADRLGVTAVALKWRLADLGRLPKNLMPGDEDLKHNGRKGRPAPKPPLFSASFAKVMGKALDCGLLSVRRAASLLGVTVDDLAPTFAAHGVAVEIGI